jgi:hypothetical protein
MLGGCKQKMVEGLMTFVPNFNFVIVTRRSFWIWSNMADTRGNFKFNTNLTLTLLLFWNFELVNKTAILNYGGHARWI